MIDSEGDTASAVPSVSSCFLKRPASIGPLRADCVVSQSVSVCLVGRKVTRQLERERERGARSTPVPIKVFWYLLTLLSEQRQTLSPSPQHRAKKKDEAFSTDGRRVSSPELFRDKDSNSSPGTCGTFFCRLLYGTYYYGPSSLTK